MTRSVLDQTPGEHLTGVLLEVFDERRAQDGKWGEQNHPDGTDPGSLWAAWINPGEIQMAAPGAGERTRDAARRLCEARFNQGYGSWLDILVEEVAEALAEKDPTALRAELIQVAAVAVAWAQAIDRRLAAEDDDS